MIYFAFKNNNPIFNLAWKWDPSNQTYNRATWLCDWLALSAKERAIQS
jgi:hypothetical protein